MAKAVELSSTELCAIVDDEDYENVSQYNWFFSNGRAGAWIGNPLDNRRANLRFCTRSQNNMNRRPSMKTSKYKGVYFRKDTGKWRAEIKADGCRSNIGCYGTEESAAIAYNEAAKSLHGEYARLNIVSA